HGPGRGCGNSINALLNGWLLSGERKYLDMGEQLIRRSIHPHDDLAARQLLDVENYWSYTVFLTVLDRYLSLKVERGELNFMYAYAQASLLHYAEWMLDNESPYFDHPERLEFPTETWAAQDIRKANVLRLAAADADEPLRSRLLRRGAGIADRGGGDLLRFESRSVTRALAVVLIEGLRDCHFRAFAVEPRPRPVQSFDFGQPEVFVPQKQRVFAQLRTPRGLGRALLKLANPRSWPRLLRP